VVHDRSLTNHVSPGHGVAVCRQKPFTCCLLHESYAWLYTNCQQIFQNEYIQSFYSMISMLHSAEHIRTSRATSTSLHLKISEARAYLEIACTSSTCFHAICAMLEYCKVRQDASRRADRVLVDIDTASSFVSPNSRRLDNTSKSHCVHH
jgi:hypothetical protein